MRLALSWAWDNQSGKWYIYYPEIVKKELHSAEKNFKQFGDVPTTDERVVRFRSDEHDIGGEVQAWVGQNITFSRLPSGKRLARTRMRSDGDDLGGRGRANSPPPRRYVKNMWVSSVKFCEYGAQTDTSPCETTRGRHTVRH